jgi:(E)-4-hydroxy-3-methylbut-2-enyl-diphosphate synthase
VEVLRGRKKRETKANHSNRRECGIIEKPLLKDRSPYPEALVESALASIALAEKENFFNFKVSIKSSDVLQNYRAYALLSAQTGAPLHLGVTEAGTKHYGAVKSAVGIGSLLMSGIGDTIRVSLSTDPVEEVKTGIYILKSIGLKNDAPEIHLLPKLWPRRHQRLCLG